MNLTSSASSGALLERLRIVRGANERLVADNGDEYLDLFNGSGTVFLGHAHPEITAAVQAQLGQVWNTGLVKTPIGLQARAAIAKYFPAAYEVAALYSTGMEAAEFALRVARVATGRPGAVGFAGDMHGKSLATAYLGWRNPHVTLPMFHRLPSAAEAGESAALERVETVLQGGAIGAVWVEPLQGSAGGHAASAAFHQQLAALCAAHGVLLVVDEIFTGFHRTGPAFYYERFGITPDVILVGKAMGNGFPVSAAVVHRRHAIQSAMLPTSTFAGNPLAAAAVTATLQCMSRMNMETLVAGIEEIVTGSLADVADAGVAVRGSGALWILEMNAERLEAVVSHLLARRIVVSVTGCFLRLLPAATVDPALLRDACGAVRESIIQSAGGRRSAR